MTHAIHWRCHRNTRRLKHPWRFQQTLGFLSGSVFELETAVPEKANTTEVPGAVWASGWLDLQCYPCRKTGVWHVHDLFSVAPGRRALRQAG